MKQTLILNEEVNDLKFIQVIGGFVVVDKTATDKEYTHVILDGKVYKIQWHDEEPYEDEISNWLDSQLFKVIFATPSLNLEGVPTIEEVNYQKEFEPFLDKIKSYYNRELSEAEIAISFISYKQAQQNLFTDQDVRKAYWEGTNDGAYFNQLINDNDDEALDYVNDNQDKDLDELIQSFKQPKVEITFESECPYEFTSRCTMDRCNCKWKPIKAILV